MSIPFRLHVPQTLYQEMIAHALAELPNECCGLLAGRVAGGLAETVGQVSRRFPLVNETASPREYRSEPRSMIEAVREMERSGLDILAIYHSHPSSPALPSRADLERTYSPDVMNLIISLAGTEPVVRGWWLTAEQYSEAVWEVMEEERAKEQD